MGSGRSGTSSSPTRRGASESAAMPPAGGIDGPAGRERLRQRRRGLGLDAHHPDPAGVPGRDAADQAAAADGHQQGVEVGGLLGQLEPERALAEQRLRLIEGVHRPSRPTARSTPRWPPARRRSDRRTTTSSAPYSRMRCDLHGRRHRGHEDPRGHAQSPGRVGDGGAVVAARGGHHARRRDRPQQQIGEGAPRLERSRVLQLLELQGEGKGASAKSSPAAATTGVVRT